MRYGDGFFNERQRMMNDNARAKYNRDCYLPYIEPEYRHETKTETTLMGIIAVCAFCSIWCVLPMRRPVGCHWATHTCADSLEIEKAWIAASEAARCEWVERMKSARRR